MRLWVSPIRRKLRTYDLRGAALMALPGAPTYRRREPEKTLLSRSKPQPGQRTAGKAAGQDAAV
jgi:hypothetical protein